MPSVLCGATTSVPVSSSSPPLRASLSPSHPEDFVALRGRVAKMAASGVRVTVIASDGQVLADSQSDSRTMENHAGRPEIRDAFAKGEGQSSRHSVTVDNNLLYYAVRLSAAGEPPVVLRFALPLQTVDQEIWEFRRRLWLASVAMLLVTGIASLLISRSFSGRVERLQMFSRRVAEGDFRRIEADRTGDTLDALAISMNQTAARLDRTIRTLTEERNLSSAILGSMVEGVAVVNASERLLFSNRGFAEILELDVPPQSGSALVEVVRQTELIEAVRKVLAGAPRVEAE